MPAKARGLRVAVVGGGWAGLAAAVRACEAGHQLELFDMAGQLGGRARSLPPDDAGLRLDNGQHILIGAYRRSLALMRHLGLSPEAALLRLPLRLRYPRHEGLRLPPGAALPAFVRGVLACRRWPWSARLGLLLAANGWLLRGFRCAPGLSVAELCQSLPQPVKDELIDPLCVAALNTPASQASASVFLRVLHDALFSGPGSSDLLLPRRPLSELLAEPAQAWLLDRGTVLRLSQRVQSLTRNADGGWQVDDQAFDRVILACSAAEAARLTAPLMPAWSAQAAALHYQPIITVYLQHPGPAWPAPMLALQEGPQAPAQFAFDLGQLSAEAAGRSAWVISGAAPWVEQGLDATAEAVRKQAQQELGCTEAPTLIRVLAEKRATFACTPGLRRPPAAVAPGLWAAGDYVEGPYPATLEGAVMAGEFAAANL